jgi:hypothetical protein
MPYAKPAALLKAAIDKDWTAADLATVGLEPTAKRSYGKPAALQRRLITDQPHERRERSATINVSNVRSRLLRYSEDQPRDDDGRFAGGGDESKKDDSSPLSAERLHEVVSEWQQGFPYAQQAQKFDMGTSGARGMEAELHRIAVGDPEPSKCEGGCKDARDFLKALNDNAKPVDGTLYRGLGLEPDVAEKFTAVGSTLDLPVSSWSSDEGTAAKFGSWAADPEEGMGGTETTSVYVLHVDDAIGWKLPDQSGGGILNEGETVTGGQYTVTKVEQGTSTYYPGETYEHTIPVTHVYLKQNQFKT